MTLALKEFVRRFCLHLLPERFVKIRHFGFLSNRQRKLRVAQARGLLNQVPPPPRRLLPCQAQSRPVSARTAAVAGSLLIEIVEPWAPRHPAPLDSS